MGDLTVPPVFLLGVYQPARGEEVTYLPVCSPEALPELQCPNPGLQSAEQHTQTRMSRVAADMQAFIYIL